MITSKLNKVLAGRFHVYETKTYIIIETITPPYLHAFVPFSRDRRRKVTNSQIADILHRAQEMFLKKSRSTVFTDKSREDFARAHGELSAILAHPSTQRFLK